MQLWVLHVNSAVFAAANPLQAQLPWESSAQDDSRFRRILLAGAGLFLLFAVLMPFLPLDELVREIKEEEPTPLARILLEPQSLPEQKQPEPVVETKPKPKPKPKPEPKPEPVAPVIQEQVKPVVPPKPVPKAIPKPIPKPVDKLKQAKDAASAAGLLAFKDDLQAMRDTVDVEALNQTQTRRGQASAQKLERNIIASEAPASSGGIATAELSTDTGGRALSGRETTNVKSQLAGTGGSGAARKGASDASTQGSPVLGGRSDEAIRRVMDSQKGAIFAIYNRALRSDPLLEGKLVFEMVIEADGSVSALRMLSSELADDALTKKILARIKLIPFGAASVLSTRVNYSFDFLPYR